VSVGKAGQVLGERVELKHMHKFSSISYAIGIVISLDYEIKRQTALLESGQLVPSETRGFDLNTMQTFHLREKEHSHEYYFMADANIPPIHISPEFIQKVKDSMPEGLDQRRNRLLFDYKLDIDSVDVLMSKPMAVEFFENTLKRSGNTEPKKVCNWILIELFGHLNKESLHINESPVDCDRLASLITLLSLGKISQLQAKNVLGKMMMDNRSPSSIAKEHGLLLEGRVDDLVVLCQQAILKHPEVVEKIKNGKPKLIGFLIGQVISQKKSANPKTVSDILKLKLDL
jgi:aspartyl-tRNA(Asn)/glutamyl-tRNA(Gln) amidotransferase subunit B